MSPDFPTWTLPVIAISLLVIALLLVGVAVAALFLLRSLSRSVDAAQGTIRESREVLALVKGEAEAIVKTSRGVRRAVVRGVRRTQEKLLDLEDLYDVVHQEVEETALDVASTLRAVRRGQGVIGRLKRLVIPGR